MNDTPKGAGVDEEVAEAAATTVMFQVDKERAAWLALRPQDVESSSDLMNLSSAFLSNLKVPKGWGEDLTPKQSMVLAVCAVRTGLNPMLGEIIMLGGNVYATEAGILKTADQHAAYEGYELNPMTEEEKQLWGIPLDHIAFMCVVSRSDRKFPYKGVGHASKSNVKMGEIKENWLSEMAQKRAIERAHSRAFPLPFNGVDEPSNLMPLRATAVVTDGAAADTEVTDEDFEIARLRGELKWSTARVEVEFKACKYDKKALIAKMQGQLNGGQGDRTSRRSAQQPAPAADAPAATVDGEPVDEAQIRKVAPEHDGTPITDPTRKKLFATLGELGIKERPERLAWAEQNGVPIKSFSDLSELQGQYLIECAEDAGPDGQPSPTPDLYKNDGPGQCPACNAPEGAIHATNCQAVYPHGA